MMDNRSRALLAVACSSLLASYIFWESIRWFAYFFLLIVSGIGGLYLGLAAALSSDIKYVPNTVLPMSSFIEYINKVKTKRNAGKSDKQRIVTSVNVDTALQELMNLIIRDYVLSWYKQFGRDPNRITSITQNEFWIAVENFSLRVKKIDKTTFLTHDCVNVVTQHVDNMQRANQKSTGPTEKSQQQVFVLHSCLENDVTELEFIRHVAEIFLVHLLPKPCFRYYYIRHLLREILACKVFKPAIDLITDPFYLNSTLYNWLVYRDQLQVEHKKTYSYAPTYEDFMAMIKHCSDVERLKNTRLNIISEIMVSTTLQNLKRAKGIDTDKSLVPKGMDKGQLLHARNLPKYINQLKLAKSLCEKRIHQLGGAEYMSYVEESQHLENIPGKKVLSFPVIMHSKALRSILASFLKKNEKNHLVRFWEATENMKKSPKSQHRRLANQIYDAFLLQKSIHINEVLNDAVVNSMKAYIVGDEGPDGFWESQSAVYNHLAENHYGSFIASDVYHRHVSEHDDFNSSYDNSEVSSPSRSELTPVKENVGVATSDISLHSTYAEEKMEVLDAKIFNKMEALNAMQQLKKQDTKKLQEKVEKEIKTLNNERRQLECHIEQTDLWIRYLGLWKVHISDADVIKAENKTTAVFVIMVNLVGMSKRATFQEISSVNSSDAWILTRNLDDFEQLHRELIQIVPKMQTLKFPSRCSSYNAESLNKTKEHLQLYINRVLEDDVLAQSEPVFAFLSKSLDLLKQSTSDVELKSNKFSMSAIFKRMVESFDRPSNAKSTVENEKDSTTMDAATQPLYNLITNVFELTGVLNWLPRALVALVQVTYGKSINRKIRETVAWIVSESMLVYYLHLFRDAYWPNGRPAESNPPPDDEHRIRVRRLAKKKFLENIPATLRNLFGEDKARRGTTKIFEAFQKPQLNKHIFYTMLEMFMKEMFVELQEDNLIT